VCIRHGAKKKLCSSKDAQIKPSKEECASSTGQRSNYAAVKDAKT